MHQVQEIAANLVLVGVFGGLSVVLCEAGDMAHIVTNGGRRAVAEQQILDQTLSGEVS